METEKEQIEEFKGSVVPSSSSEEGRSRKRARKMMEKSIYINISYYVELDEEEIDRGQKDGEDDEEIDDDPFYRLVSDWRLIKQVQGGDHDGVKLTPVFGDVSHSDAFSGSLWRGRCIAIGSCIYMVNGRGMIKFIDTRKPKDGWTTLCTMPYNVCDLISTTVNGRWLYVLGGDVLKRNYHLGFAVNVDDSEIVPLVPPADLSGLPIFAACVSPEKVVVGMYIDGNCSLCEIDCKNNTWTRYMDKLPCDEQWLVGCAYYVVDDGILYIYNCSDMQFTSIDIRQKEKLYEVSLPHSIKYYGNTALHLVVLSKNRFCIVWEHREDFNKLLVFYSRFSVSIQQGWPTIDLEENEVFPLDGNNILKVMAVDPVSDG